VKRYVVDKNYFESEKMAKFLSASRNNIALITDFSAMESYSGDPLKNIQRSMEIISRYPEQVKILHSTRYAVRSKPRIGNKRHLIDEKSTREFSAFCLQIEGSKNGDQKAIDAIDGHGAAANMYLDEMLKEYDGFTPSLKEAKGRFNKIDLRRYIDDGMLPRPLRDSLIRMTMEMTALFYHSHPERPSAPSDHLIRESFLFRFSLVAVAQFMLLCRDGLSAKMSHRTMRNDTIDANYITYATLFDGILTEECKVRSTYRLARMMLRDIFV